MLIDTNAMFSITQANQNFSAVARCAEKNGEAIIMKNNKAKFMVLDIEKSGAILDFTDDEKIKIVAGRILERYLPAFRELAK